MLNDETMEFAISLVEQSLKYFSKSDYNVISLEDAQKMLFMIPKLRKSINEFESYDEQRFSELKKLAATAENNLRLKLNEFEYHELNK